MPENCAFVNCPHSRRYEGMSLFKIPSPRDSDSDYTKGVKLTARSAWKAEILKTRQETSELRERFKKNNIFLCEKHFDPSSINAFNFTDKNGKSFCRKTLTTGAIPTVNLPTKPLDCLPSSTSCEPRRVLVRNEVDTSSTEHTSSPPSFAELVAYFQRKYQYLKDWTVAVTNSNVTLEQRELGCLVPKYFIQIDDCLDLIVMIYGAKVPLSSVLYPAKSTKLSCKFQDLHSTILKLSTCPGLTLLLEQAKDSFLHVIPMVVKSNATSSVNYRSVVRAKKCYILIDANDTMCKACIALNEKQATLKPAQPARARAPLSACSAAKLQETVKQDRIMLKDAKLKSEQLQQRLDRMEDEIRRHGVNVGDDLNESFLSIIENKDLQTTPHMRLIFEQQQKAMESSKYGHKWHPHFIEFCLSIHAKSSYVYNDLRKSESNPDGILYLPHERTLRDYRNHFKPEAGFNLPNIKLLDSMVNTYQGAAKYVILVFDEMKISGRLVFDKHSGKLIGFSSLGDPELDFSTFEELEMASHVLAFMIRGIQTTLKFMVAYFFTRTVVSYQLMPLFWRAVSVLHFHCGLYVVAAVSDGMSANRKFFKLHQHICPTTDKSQEDMIFNKTINSHLNISS